MKTVVLITLVAATLALRVHVQHKLRGGPPHGKATDIPEWTQAGVEWYCKSLQPEGGFDPKDWDSRDGCERDAVFSYYAGLKEGVALTDKAGHEAAVGRLSEYCEGDEEGCVFPEIASTLREYSGDEAWAILLKPEEVLAQILTKDEDEEGELPRWVHEAMVAECGEEDPAWEDDTPEMDNYDNCTEGVVYAIYAKEAGANPNNPAEVQRAIDGVWKFCNNNEECVFKFITDKLNSVEGKDKKDDDEGPFPEWFGIAVKNTFGDDDHFEEGST